MQSQSFAGTGNVAHGGGRGSHPPRTQLPGRYELESLLLRETRPQVWHIDSVAGGTGGTTSKVPEVSWPRVLTHFNKYTSRLLREAGAFAHRVHSDAAQGRGLVAMDNAKLVNWVETEYRSAPVTGFYSAFVQTQQYSHFVSQTLALPVAHSS
jgi:hypothetical protein